MRVNLVCACTLISLVVCAPHVAAQQTNADGGPDGGGSEADAGLDGGSTAPPSGPPTTPLPELPPATALTDAGNASGEDETASGCACIAPSDTAIDARGLLAVALVLTWPFRRRRTKSG